MNKDAQTSDTPARMLRGPRVVIGVFAVMGIMVLGAVVAPSLALRHKAPELDVYGELPAFRLQDQTGATISNTDLSGKVVVVNFIFTRCVAVCPLFTMKMHRVQERTNDAAEDLKLISFSVDPDHDTPAVLADYAKQHNADPSRWRFVTGNYQEVHRVLSEGFAVAMDKIGTQINGAPNIVHAEHFVLLDRQGRIRGYYDSNDANRVERMLRDARRLIKSTR